ncbi:MAG TPA: T9SS type A sorting domain-containing protein, partial [Balneolaceae bacterium]|nr:T9SS type A sorting domain-containing protein [Balneolaceae bacterium]
SIAKDRVGNIESPKNGADMSLMVTVSNEEIISGLPDSFELFQNYPNPFNPSTTINFALPEQSDVTIRIYDVMGRQIATLLNENRPAGYHNIVWDAGSVASGTYFYRIQAGSFLSVKKLTLVK